jgi:very-short-patch-repair endonuclease
MAKRVPPHMTRDARALRNDPTLPEFKLWQILSPYRPRFTRQLVVGPYIADLAHRTAGLVIEIDGEQHVDNADDVIRTQYLEAKGWTVIRFWNHDVLDDPYAVAKPFWTTPLTVSAGPTPNPSLPGRGAGSGKSDSHSFPSLKGRG